MNFKHYLSIFLLLFIPLLSYPSTYTLVNIGTKGELKDNYIHAIYKGTDGLVWLGTGTSVERWDGIQSTVYEFPENSLEYTPYLVNVILEKEPYDFWFGTKKGLWHLNNETRTLEHFFSEQINSSVYALAKDAENNLYIGTENGLFIYRNGEIRHVRLLIDSKPLRNNCILAVEIDRSNIWLMTPDGLVLYESQAEAIKFYPHEMAESDKLTACSRVGNQFYLGTEKHGVITYDISENSYSYFWSDINVPVSALSYEDGLLGVATLGEGILLISLEENELVYKKSYHPETKDGLISSQCSSILLSDGDVWCGMDYYLGMNLLRKKNSTFGLYSNKKFSSVDVPVRAMHLTEKQIFISNRDGIICIARDTEEVRYFNSKTVGEQKLRSDLIFSFYEYEGLLLLGTYSGGVSAMELETYRFVETPLTKALKGNDIFMFLEDKESNLWMATSAGLYFYNKQTKQIKEYNSFNSGLPGNMIYGIFIDSANRFWVSTIRGVTLFDPLTETASQEFVPDEIRLRNEPVRNVYEGRDGTLFFYLMNKGNSLFTTDKNLTNFRYPTSGECYSAIQDEQGYYWAVTEFGIVRMNEELSHCVLITSADGIPNAPMTPGPSIVKDIDQQLWIANMRGIIVVDPHKPFIQSSMKISDALVNGEYLLDKEFKENKSPLILDKDENNIVFSFASLGYEEADKLRYEYKLEGLETDWIRLYNENKVSYYKLKPGNYTFKVRKLLNPDSEDKISFTIKDGFPPVMFLLIGIAIFIPIYILRRRKHSLVASAANIVETDGAEGKCVETVSESSYVKLTEQEADKLISELKAFMELNKPYLNVDLKQSDIATALGHSSYLLSALFTHYLKIGYYDFVNSYRISEFKKRVTSGEHKKVTLLALAEQCGFKSKTSFFRSFKKVTGVTPNEYIHQTDEK